jgi:hypothetical protein
MFRVQKTHVPLAKCRVLYLGSSVPLETVQGLDALQVPLRQRYVCSASKGDVSGIDLWLKAYSSGLMLTPVDDPVASIWFPIQSLKVCAAIKCVESLASPDSARFVALDSAEAAGTKHPPLFASVMRRGKGIKVLECHVFICKSDHSALELVRSLMYAHDNKDGWLDEEDMPDIFLAPLHPTIVPDTSSGTAVPPPAVTNTMVKQLPDFSTNSLPQKPKLDRKDGTNSAPARRALVERSVSTSTTTSTTSSEIEKQQPKKSLPKTKAPLRQATETTLKKNTKAAAAASPVKATPATTAVVQPATVPVPVPVPVPMMNGGMIPVNPMLPPPMAYSAVPNYYADWNMYGSMPYFEAMGGDPYDIGKPGKEKDKKKNKSNFKSDKAAAAAAAAYNARMQEELMMQAYASYPAAIYPSVPVAGIMGGYPFPTMMPMPMRMDDWWQQAYNTSSLQREERQPATRRHAADPYNDRNSDLGYYSDDVYHRGSSSRTSENSYYYRDRYNRSPAEQEKYFERTIIKDSDLRQRQNAANQRRLAGEAIYAPVNKGRAGSASNGSPSREQEDDVRRQNTYYAASSVSSSQHQSRTLQHRPPSERGSVRESSPQSYVRHIDVDSRSYAGTRTSVR